LKIAQKPEPSLDAVVAAGQLLTDACHARAHNAGWWHDGKTGVPRPRSVSDLLVLVHSEISEAVAGYRKDLMDDHLPHRKMLEVELADAVIRIFDMAGGLGLDLAGAMAEKMDYNARRQDHQAEIKKGQRM
jgi:NTP pyrophosphatase (non-canonical NTP hydrolase)